MTLKHISVAELLIDIEAELRAMQLWEFEQPSLAALSSTEPFAIDTLTFPQWLQFIFLPRMYQLVDAKAPLPAACGIKPMAEQYFYSFNVHSGSLILYLEKIDALLSE